MVETLIFSCSGAADVGELADKTARELTKKGFGTMFCLAGIGGDVDPIVERTKSAYKRLVIDGCQVACAKKLFEKAGLNDFEYIQVTNLGYEKGKTLANQENVMKVFNESKKLI